MVRNYSFFIAAAAFSSAACSAASATASFQSLAHFISTNTKPSGTMGDTQKTMTISATSFRGYNRFSPLLISSHVNIQSNAESERRSEANRQNTAGDAFLEQNPAVPGAHVVLFDCVCLILFAKHDISCNWMR